MSQRFYRTKTTFFYIYAFGGGTLVALVILSEMIAALHWIMHP